MMSKKIIKRILAMSLVAVIAFGMTVQAASLSASALNTSDEELSSSMSEAQKEKEELEKQLKEAKKLINELKDSKEDITDKVKNLNQQLLNISSQITVLENQLADKSNQITETQAQLEQAKAEERKQYADMKIRIQYMYENSRTSYLQMLLESKSVADFLNTAEYIAQIENYDREKLNDYQENIEYIAGIEAQLEQDRADLETMKASVESEKQSVAALMNQKETELAYIADNISSAQSEAEAYAAEIQAQEEIIAEIKRIEAEKARLAAEAAAAGQTVVDNPYTGGTFTWPCPSSTRITSDYGTRISPTAGASSNHKGIDIGASTGADIVAAAGGTVKVATYSSSAGNYIMIDHGGGLYTVYMHCSSLVASVGQEVSAGQLIAKVGSTGISTGSHLHFGVSLNGSYVSPWSYLG